MGRSRASAFHPLYLGIDRQTQGRAALFCRLPAVGIADDEVDLRHQAAGYFLVYRRHRLGHRPHLHHLWPAGSRCNPDRVRRRADLPECRTFLGHDPEAQGDHFLHCAHRDPLAHQGCGRRCTGASEPIRPVEPAPARLGRRTDQPRSMDVVLPECRARALPGRRYLLADRDRRPHDHAAAGRDPAGSRILHPAAAGHHGCGGRRNRSGPAERAGRHPGGQAAMAVDDPYHLGRSRTLQEELLPGRARRQDLSRGRRCGTRREDRLFHDHRPHRRRPERVRSPDGHDGNRIGPGCERPRCRSRGGWQAG